MHWDERSRVAPDYLKAIQRALHSKDVDERVQAQLALANLGVSVVPYVGDYAAAFGSIVNFGAYPSWENFVEVCANCVGAALPAVGPLGTIAKFEHLATLEEAAADVEKLEHAAELGATAAEGAGAGSTRLFRAVEDEELKDVLRFGDYNIHPNSTFKRFAFSEGDLDAFIQSNPGRSYTKTFVDIPTDKLQFMYQHADPGGVGRAVGIDVFETPEFYDWFMAPVQIIQ
jgi:hypothetical protein